MSNYREVHGESDPRPLHYKFIKGAGDRPHEEALHKASKDGYTPIQMVIGNSGEIVILTENNKMPR